MLLNSILMNLQGQVNSAHLSAENPDAASLDGEQGSSASDFSMLFDQFGLTAENGLDEQELTALLADFVEQAGEMLPQDEAFGLGIDALDDETAEPLDRDQLLAFLMANASKEVSPQIKDAFENLPSIAEASSDFTELNQGVEERVVMRPSELDEVIETVEVDVAVDETAIQIDSDDLSKDALSSSEKNQVNTVAGDHLEDASEVLTDALEIEPLIDEAAADAKVESDHASSSAEAEDILDVSVLDNSSVDRTVEEVAAVSEAVTASAAANPVIAGDLKNQATEANRLAPINSGTLSGSHSEEATVNAALQSAIQNQSVTSESVDGKTDALVRDSLEGKAGADDVNAEADLEPPSSAQLPHAANRGSEKTPPSTINSQLLADQLNRPVRLANAHQALTERITTMVSNEIKQAVIQLDPAELGHIEIRLHMQNEQTQVQIVASTAQTRDALEQQAARLRESFNAQGLNLSQLDVSDQSAHQYQGEGGQSGRDEGGQDRELAEPLETERTVQQAVGLVNHFV